MYVSIYDNNGDLLSLPSTHAKKTKIQVICNAGENILISIIRCVEKFLKDLNGWYGNILKISKGNKDLAENCGLNR